LLVRYILSDPVFDRFFFPVRCFAQQVFYQQVIVDMVEILFQPFLILNV
jgi:hypothetical protein